MFGYSRSQARSNRTERGPVPVPDVIEPKIGKPSMNRYRGLGELP